MDIYPDDFTSGHVSLDKLSRIFKFLIRFGLRFLPLVRAPHPFRPSQHLQFQGSAHLCLISLSDFSNCAPALPLFLSSSSYFSAFFTFDTVCQGMPPQPSVNSWPLAELPHYGQLAPSGHFIVLQTERTRESLRLLSFEFGIVHILILQVGK